MSGLVLRIGQGVVTRCIGGIAGIALRVGAAAIVVLAAAPSARAQSAPQARQQALAQAGVGRYSDAEQTARRGTQQPGGIAVQNTLGEILVLRGRRAEAESAFVRAAVPGSGAPDSLMARFNLAAAHYEDGRHDLALSEFDRFIDVYNAHADSLTSDEMTAVALAVERLGATNPELFKDALKAFDRAIALDGTNLRARNALGEMFLAKYNSADAQRTFEGALAVGPDDPGALLGAARRLAFDGQPGADSLVNRALAINPSYVPALVFRASQLVDLEYPAQAQQDVDRALSVNPNSVGALAVAAGIRYVAGDTVAFGKLNERAEAASPRNPSFYTDLAESAGRVRLYSAAAAFARQAIVADPRAWHAYAVLGMNQMRLGQIAKGRASLETAFKGDPYDVWTKNTLDLLDTFKNYDEVTDGKFQFMIEKDESAILSIYMKQLVQQAYDLFSTRYGYTPPPPIRIEVYRSHADFSVRTVGMAGLGALGVSFGTTLAFDSPAARDAGPFNWGSTMWHELAHTFTLGVSDHRVPRWFSEGLSVWEEHRGRPGWGFHVTPAFLQAFQAGKLVPVSRMNDGFMRPAYPGQLQFSYYQASLVCDLIARDWGDSALVQMLHGYARREGTEQVFRSVLHTDLKAFDARFTAYVQERFARQLRALSGDSTTVDALQPVARLSRLAAEDSTDFRVQLQVAHALIQRNETDAAVPVVERARRLFPEFSAGQDDGPYRWLARTYDARRDYARAADVLRGITANDETDYAIRLELARVLEAAGDIRGAADALEGAIFVNPFEIPVHEHLAELAEALKDHALDVRERQAVVALNPADLAGAYYRLALAQHVAGDDVSARRSVLRSLEQAPNFAQAQELLLAMVDGGGYE
ncbi:MAG TPA: tetratricopeptide repeat protein [Gemmatimonadaceae bacterium]|nr:tetratricopeptide repeat protein [Gemmatimonadaceae bacterium]